MELKDSSINYWFTIEPYVFVGFHENKALLYNTLDGSILKSDKTEVIKLLCETFQKDNCGVVLLTNERYNQKDINLFINQLRDKFMGDIIDINLSKGKPVQLFPYYNYLDKKVTLKSIYSSENKNILENLFEISLHFDSSTKTMQLISLIRSIPNMAVFNLVGKIKDIIKHRELLSSLGHLSANKYIFCSYKDIVPIQLVLENTFAYKIVVRFPIDAKKWKNTKEILLNQHLSYEYVFEVSSDEDCLITEELIEKHQIKKYKLTQIYNGNNIVFFEKNVFLCEEDILSSTISIKDFFIRQSMNIYDFCKITIMPNGDAYANVNQPMLGNIFSHSIYEIVQKEMDEGKSWFRIRDQAPCNRCIYQWLCPSPSTFEIILGRSNLCHIKPQP